MPDIFDAFPALQQLADSFSVPEDDENEGETPADEGAEIASEPNGDATYEASQGEAERREGDNPTQEQSPLDVALQQALAEQQGRAAYLGQQAALQQLQTQAPRLVAFDDLDESVQNQVLAEAEAAGVDPQTVLYTRYNAERATHAQQVSSLDARIQGQRQEAFTRVRDFVQSNEHVRALPAADRDAFIASIGNLDAVRDLESLAWIDPQGWARSVCRVAGEQIAALGAKNIVKADNEKQQAAMKQSVATGKSAAASKVQTPQQDTKRFVLEAAATSHSWDRRLKPKS